MGNKLIRAEVVYDYSGLDNLIEFTAEFPAEVKKVAKREFNQRIRLGLLSQLRKTPRRRSWDRTDFVSDASRRAFFAKTHGKPYQRTGALAAAWQVGVVESDNAIAFYASNSKDYEKWVTGNRQVKGHIRTGWGKHETVLDAWRPRVVDVVVNAVGELIDSKVGNG